MFSEDEVLESLQEMKAENPFQSSNYYALALCEIYPELSRDEAMDLIETN